MEEEPKRIKPLGIASNSIRAGTYDGFFGYPTYAFYHEDNPGVKCAWIEDKHQIFYTEPGLDKSRDAGWRVLRQGPELKTMKYYPDITAIITDYLNYRLHFLEHSGVEGELMTDDKKTELDIGNLEEKFPSNALGKKKETKGSGNKQLASVVTGEAGVRKKGAKKFINKTAIKSNARKVLDFVTRDVIFPTIRDAISEIVKGGIDIMLYPEGSPRGRTGVKQHDRNHVRYDKMSRSAPRQSRYGYANESTDRWSRSANQFDDIGYQRRLDANNVLDSLMEVARVTNYASVADMKDLSGSPSSYVDNGFGWDEQMLARVAVVLDRGEYILTLPEPIPIPED